GVLQQFEMLVFAKKVGFVGGDQINRVLAFYVIFRRADDVVVFPEAVQPQLIQTAIEAAEQQDFFLIGESDPDLFKKEFLKQAEFLIAQLECAQNERGRCRHYSKFSASTSPAAMPTSLAISSSETT